MVEQNNIKLKEKWQQFKSSPKYHNLVVFIMFVIISSIFWFIITLNDDSQNDFNVELQINNIPKNVTFINDAPKEIHVNVRDKVVSLIRGGILKRPIINLDFNKYADKGIFRISSSELNSELRNIFGNSANIASASIDSLRLIYTTYPGKRVKIVTKTDFTPALGSTISNMSVTPQYVTLYSDANILDTIKQVFTEKITKHNISESTTIQTKIRPIKGVKIIPEKVNLKINVEPLVLRKSIVEILPKNVPNNENLMIFPSKTEVSFFVPMSKFNEPIGDIILQVDYNSISQNSSKIKVKVTSYPSEYINVKSKIDSVEYTIVKIANK